MPTHAERLKDLRARAGFRSAREAAEAAGIDKETLYDFEAGKARQMQPRTRAKFFKLAELYGVPVDQVLPDATPTEKPPEVFVSYSRSDELPHPLSKEAQRLITAGPDIDRKVGTRGLVTVWSLVDLLEYGHKSGDELNEAIESFFKDFKAKLPKPKPKRRPSTQHHTRRKRA